MEQVKLSVEVEPELRRRVKMAAASKDQSVKQWIRGAILHKLGSGEGGEEESISHLSAGAFGRDWDSEEDSVYDELS